MSEKSLTIDGHRITITHKEDPLGGCVVDFKRRKPDGKWPDEGVFDFDYKQNRDVFGRDLFHLLTLYQCGLFEKDMPPWVKKAILSILKLEES